MSNSHPLPGRRVVLADDTDFVRDGAAVILRQCGLEVDLCSSGAELQHVLASDAARFDATIVDLGGMGDDFSPDQALPALVAAYPQLPFIVFSAEDVLARQLLSDGVKGYVVKSDEASSIIRALEALLLEGQPLYCSPRVRREQLLSRRELQVLQLIADGFTTKGAAHQLGISDDAVDEYRKRLFAKLDARSAAQAVAIGMRKGLLR